MNVRALQQFLQTLATPLRASGASQQTLTALERMARGLEPFAERPIGEFAVFLERAHGYEQAGHWPASKPPIKGEVIDGPSPAEYADRLKRFLQQVVPPTGPMPESVLRELNSLKTGLKPASLKEIAAACGVTGNVSSANAAIEKAFERVTGRKLPEALTETYHSSLLNLKDDPVRLGLLLDEVQGTLNVTQLKKIAGKLGVREAIRSKQDGIAKIRNMLTHPSISTVPAQPAIESRTEAPSLDHEKIQRITEILKDLKRKSEPEHAPFEEIEDELNRLEEQMSKDEAIAAAKRFGIDDRMSGKSDAMKRIREEVFETRSLREKIRY